MEGEREPPNLSEDSPEQAPGQRGVWREEGALVLINY